MAAMACLSLSVSFMVCDLRSHAGANNTRSRLASLVADELARAAQGDRDNPDSPRPRLPWRGGSFDSFLGHGRRRPEVQPKQCALVVRETPMAVWTNCRAARDCRNAIRALFK